MTMRAIDDPEFGVVGRHGGGDVFLCNEKQAISRYTYLYHRTGNSLSIPTYSLSSTNSISGSIPVVSK